MGKQFVVYLSNRQLFDVYGFVASVVQPKDRTEARALKGVFETFGLDEIQEKLETLTEGEKITRMDFSDDAKPIETGSVDLNTLLDYLNKPGATAIGSLKLLVVSDELQRAKENKPRGQLESVPEEVETK